MELQTISQVSKTYGVSVRMLRYYEEEGLIESKRKEDYAYRVYDETAIRRLQQIIILRKLQIPVKDIGAVLDNPNALETIEFFKQNISELDDEISALSTIRSILSDLVVMMQEKVNISIPIDLASDTSILPLVESLSFVKNKIKENLSMEELNKASETLGKLKKPELRVFQIKQDEFLYLGVEFKRGSVEYWNEFDKMGGWDMVAKYHKKPYNTMMTMWRYNDPENQIYFPGTIAENVDDVPDGFTLKKFPACEFLVITTQWMPSKDDIWRENGSAWTCIDNRDNAKLIPDGYERYGGPDNQITLVERENHDAENGFRYEVWVPIRPIKR